MLKVKILIKYLNYRAHLSNIGAENTTKCSISKTDSNLLKLWAMHKKIIIKGGDQDGGKMSLCAH